MTTIVTREGYERTKEADLLMAVIHYATRCLAEGDLRALNDIGFRAQDLAALENMTLADIHALSFAKANALVIQIDREVLRWQVERVLRSRHRQRLENDLLQAEAPHDMMRHLFGWNLRKFMARRTQLGIKLKTGCGRPRRLSPQAEESLWNLWLHLAHGERPGDLRTDDLWLLVARAWRDAGLRDAWQAIQRWSQEKNSLASLARFRAAQPRSVLEAYEQRQRAAHQLPTVASVVAEDLRHHEQAA